MQLKIRTISFSWLKILILITLLMLLTGYAIQGTYSRYLQDDYCYGAEVIQQGFLNAQFHSYFTFVPYNGNRYALTFFSTLAEVSGGPALVPFLPVLLLITWAGGLFFAIRQWNALQASAMSRLDAGVLALTLLFFSMYLSNALYQVIFWRSAMIPYALPLVINSWLAGLAFRYTHKPKSPAAIWLVFGLLAFLAAGTSETAALWQFAVWMAVLVFAWSMQVNYPFRAKIIRIAIYMVVLTIAGIILLAVNPANDDRSRVGGFVRPDLVTLVASSLKFGLDFVLDTIKSKILPFLIVFFTGLWIGAASIQIQPLEWKKLLEKLGLSLAMIYGLSVAGMIPTMLAMSAYPGDRALFPAHFSLTAGLLWIGWHIGRAIKGFLTRRQAWFAVCVLLSLGLGILAYNVRIAPKIYSGFSPYHSRAVAWDQRHASILLARQAGQTHVTVPAFDSIELVLELRPNEGFWVNRCAAVYYQVEGISAVEYYNGVKPFFR